MQSTTGSLFRTAPSTAVPPAAWVGRGFSAAGILMSADIHLVLYAEGFSDISVIGPAFMANFIGGVIIALLVLIWRNPIALLLAIGFGVATLVAYYISATVGLFGVKETWGGTQVVLAHISEWVAIIGAVVALVAERRSARQ